MKRTLLFAAMLLGSCRPSTLPDSLSTAPVSLTAREEFAQSGYGFLEIFSARLPMFWDPAHGLRSQTKGPFPRTIFAATPDLRQIVWAEGNELIVEAEGRGELRYPVPAETSVEDAWARPGDRLLVLVYSEADPRRRFVIDVDLASPGEVPRRFDAGPRSQLKDVQGERACWTDSKGDIYVGLLAEGGVKEGKRVGNGFAARFVGESIFFLPFSGEAIVSRSDEGATYPLLRSDPPEWRPKPFRSDVRTLHGGTLDGKWLFATERREVDEDPRFIASGASKRVRRFTNIGIRMSDGAVFEAEAGGFFRTWTSRMPPGQWDATDSMKMMQNVMSQERKITAP